MTKITPKIFTAKSVVDGLGLQVFTKEGLDDVYLVTFDKPVEIRYVDGKTKVVEGLYALANKHVIVDSKNLYFDSIVFDSNNRKIAILLRKIATGYTLEVLQKRKFADILKLTTLEKEDALYCHDDTEEASEYDKLLKLFNDAEIARNERT